MLRFLRRYNKGILVVGGVLLLVAWSISGSLDQISKATAGRGATWATVGGQSVRTADIQSLQGQLQVIDAVDRFGSGSILPLPEAGKDPLYFYMLRKEVVDNGLLGTSADGIRWLESNLTAGGAQINAEQWIAMVATSSGQSPQTVIDTLGTVSGMRRLVGMTEDAARVSDRRLQAAASQMLAAVDADIVVLDARRMSETLDWTPTQEQLEAQLAMYGSKTAGVDGARFGYKLPNRLKLEWLTIPAASIRATVESSDRLSNIELRKHRDRNLALFPKPASGEDDFEGYREQIRNHRLNELVAERTAELAKFTSDQLALPLRGVPRAGVYHALPTDWDTKRLSFEQLASAIAQQFQIAPPIYQTSGPDWIEPTGVDRLPGLLTATSDRFGPTPVKASALVAQTKEFAGSDIYAIQQGVAGPVLTSGNGDLVVFRIIDTDPARAPRSVDEVRDRLVADLKAVEQFELLKKSTDALVQQAATDGFVELASANNASISAAIDLREVNPQFLGAGIRIAPSVPGLGQSDEAVKKIIEFATRLPAQGAAGGPGAKPVAELVESERIFAFPVDDRLAVVVGRVTDVTALTIEEFQGIAGSGAIQRTVIQDEVKNLRNELFGRDALMKRHEVVLADVAEEDAKAKQDAIDAAKAAAGS